MQYKDSLNKKDVIWSYASRGLSLCSGLITLPLVLNMLSEADIAMNYLMGTLMSLVVLFDMGFSQQFARNFAFVFGGAQEISKEGTPNKTANFVNYELLYQLVHAARKFYGYISVGLSLVMFSFGTWYIYRFTDGFTLVNHSLEIWVLFSLSVVFDFYYKYYTPLLMGRGLIFEVNKIEVYTISIRILILTVLLLAGFGLWGVVISNFMRLVIVRFYSIYCFFTPEIKKEFSKFNEKNFNYWEIIKILWFNARKSLIVSATNFTCSQLGMLFSGVYMGKTEVAGYGLLLQLVNIVSGLSIAVHQNTVPIYSTLKTRNDEAKIKENFFLSMGVCYWIFIGGAAGVIIIGPPILNLIGANAVLPATYVSVVTFLYRFLQNQHIICSTYMCSHNKIVDFESSTILGISNFVLLWVVLHFTSWGLIGLVMVQFLTALAYPNWKWPYEVCKEFKINFPQFVYLSFKYTNNKIIKVIKC